MHLAKGKLIFLVFIVTSVLPNFGYSQKNTIQLTGKVSNPYNEISDVLIVNLNSKESTITDSLGVFKIEVSLKDSIQFTAVQYQTKQIVITNHIIDEKFVIVNLIQKLVNLDEVTVTPYNLSGKLNIDIESLNIESNVNSSTLKLPNADLEKMTHSERLLFEADQGKYFYLGFGFTINTHKLMNKLSGRTKSLEQIVSNQKDIDLEKEILSKFTKEAISDGFDIHPESVNAFLTFCIFQDDFSKLSQSTSNAEIWNYLKRKSNEFKERVD